MEMMSIFVLFEQSGLTADFQLDEAIRNNLRIY
jgi:hypothetical protein